jgi:hypothetical protein
MGEFAETSSAKKPNPAFVTVKATVRGQLQEIQFESESLLLLLEHLRSGFTVSGGFLLNKNNIAVMSLQSGETYTFVGFLDVTSSTPSGIMFSQNFHSLFLYNIVYQGEVRAQKLKN